MIVTGKTRINSFFLFIAKSLFLYLVWFFVYDCWLHPLKYLDKFVIDHLSGVTNFLLLGSGFSLIPPSASVREIIVVGIDGTHGLWIGPPCNGITLFALFSGFIIAFPGPWKKKLWFIPGGILLIHILNILRIYALCIILKFFPDALEINHTYTFTIITYSSIFFLWMFWASRLSGLMPEKKITNPIAQ